ncbi:hypothetical protein [Thalassotalea sp. PLHSN55]|uniref:hypothetical protein n=1 Tax=Thalassotalea sp. PLHSN55 TaxID=3435888 RepID=UPI003F836CDA
MFLKTAIPLVLLSSALLSTLLAAKETKPISNLVLAEHVKWGYLNPLRGDKSPAALIFASVNSGNA